MAMAMAYPISNYSYDPIGKPKLFQNFDHHLQRMIARYDRKQPRVTTTVEAILLVHAHNHLHILLLKVPLRTTNMYMLPGGRLKPGEDEIEGLKRKLSKRLGGHPDYQPTWQIGECVAVWWRPNFKHPIYPYCPPHVTKPKECKKLFLVNLPEKEYFGIPENLELVAVPLFDLYDNDKKFGRVISHIPQQISWLGIKKITLEEVAEEP